MRVLLWILILFSLAVGLMQFAQFNNGYAILFIPPWRIELSVNTFIILTALLVVALHYLLRLVAEITGLPEKARLWRLRRAREHQLAREYEARLAFEEGRFQRAERIAADAARHSSDDNAFAANLLLAARAAHQYRDYARRDQHFDTLQKRLGRSHLATAMCMADLLIDERRYAEASAAIDAVRAQSPKLTAALRLELRLRQREDDHDAVIRIVEQLLKSEALDTDVARRIRTQAYLGKLRLQGMSTQELRDWWRRLPVADKAQPHLVKAVIDQLQALGDTDAACTLIEQTLDAQWSGDLAERYGVLALDAEALGAQIARAESWLVAHRDDHQLLLTLGRLCRATSLWGKAQNYLEASIAIKPTAIAHAELADLNEQLDRSSEANAHYRAGLALALSR
jgi:HemY protein